MPNFRASWVNRPARELDPLGVVKAMIVLDVDTRRIAVERKVLRAWVWKLARRSDDRVVLYLQSLGDEPALPRKYRRIVADADELITCEEWG